MQSILERTMQKFRSISEDGKTEMDVSYKKIV